MTQESVAKHESEPIRQLDTTLVEGRCIDCGEMVTGMVGVRFLNTPEGPGVEICVCRDRSHALGRVKLHLIPVVKVEQLG